MTQSLGRNQLVPVAQPVSTFIQAARPNVAPPPNPISMGGNPPQITQVARIQAAEGIGGFNQIEQLAAALTPFSQNLLGLGMTAMTTYASYQYQKGQAEVRKAMVLSNQAREKSAGEYARETRRLEGKDPVAARMMDQVNPFREAGRINALSQIAAQQIGPALINAYESSPDAPSWRRGDPRLTELRARTTADVLDQFGLTADTHGFADYVEPEIGKWWDRVAARHEKDHTDLMKQAAYFETKAKAFSIWHNAKRTGEVEYTTTDENGQLVKRVALAGTEEFALGVAQNVTEALAGTRNYMGLRGETVQLQAAVMNSLIERSEMDQDWELKAILGMVQIQTLPDSSVPAQWALNDQFLNAQKEIEPWKYAQLQRQQAEALKVFQTEYMDLEAKGLEGAALIEARAALMNDPRFEGIEKSVLAEAGNEAAGVHQKFMEGTLPTDGPLLVEDALAQMETVPPSVFLDPKTSKEAREGFRNSIKTLLPADQWAAAMKRYDDIVERKVGAAGKVNMAPLMRRISPLIRSIIQQRYPKAAAGSLFGPDGQLSQEAINAEVMRRLGGGSGGDPSAAIAANNLQQFFMNRYTALAAELAPQRPNGLTEMDEEMIAQQVASEALSDQQLNQLLPAPKEPPSAPSPGGGGATSGGGARGAAKPRYKPVALGRYKHLTPEQMRATTVDKPGFDAALNYIGGRGQLHPDLRKALEQSGESPLQWFERNARQLGVQMGPRLRERLKEMNKVSNAGNALTDLIAGLQGAANRYAGQLLNVAMGIPPANAATRSMYGGGQRSNIPFSQRTSPTTARASGGRYGGYYEIGNIGPTSTGDHADIKQVKGPGGYGGYFDRGALDKYVLVNGKPISSLVTVGGGRFGASRPYGEHRAWDYAPAHGSRSKMTLHNGARWLGTKPSEHGDVTEFQIPDGRVFRVIHGKAFTGAPTDVYSGTQRTVQSFTGNLTGIINRLQGRARVVAAQRAATRGLFTPRPAFASRGMGAGVPTSAQRYLRSLSELETDNRNIRGATRTMDGSFPQGRFQFNEITLKDAEQLGIPRAHILSADERVQYPAVMRFIQKRHPDAYAAILRGDYNTADRLLNRRWTSLPGGPEQAKPERMQRAMRFRSGG